MMLKRDRALDEAMAVWRDMEARGLGGLMPYIELSKAYEHRLRDYRAALTKWSARGHMRGRWATRRRLSNSSTGARG